MCHLPRECGDGGRLSGWPCFVAAFERQAPCFQGPGSVANSRACCALQAIGCRAAGLGSVAALVILSLPVSITGCCTSRPSKRSNRSDAARGDQFAAARRRPSRSRPSVLRPAFPSMGMVWLVNGLAGMQRVLCRGAVAWAPRATVLGRH